MESLVCFVKENLKKMRFGVTPEVPKRRRIAKEEERIRL